MDHAKNREHRITGTTPSMAAEQAARLRELFPECVTEGKIDFEKLRATLGDEVDQRPERYSFTWAGKRDAIRILQTPSRATLKPCPDESLDWDTTQNVFIEGENLEVLKLLYKSYFGRVKMIYIDPPYNTGNDFVYPDNYADPLDTYLKMTGQRDSQGNLITSNPETSGRYHSAWLSMMYPRLFVARQLLRDDGVIFISIDDEEVGHLRMLCDEIFGSENLCGVIKRRAARKTAFLRKRMTDMCDYIVAYVRSESAAPLSAGQVSDGTRPVFNERNKITLRILRDGARAACPDGIYKASNYSPRTVSFELVDDLRIQHAKVLGDVRIRGHWRINQEVLDKTLFVTRNLGLRRTMLTEELERAKLLNDLLDNNNCYNEKGTEELRGLFGDAIFSNPKPRGLIEYLASAAGLQQDDLVVDFFAGSGTTGHGIMAQNAQRNDNRRFILVQLPEPLDSCNKEQKAAADFCDQIGKPRNIAELAKERLRRASKKVKGENPMGTIDLGFRVYRLSESTCRPWHDIDTKDAENLPEQMKLFADPLLPGWKADDVIWEVAVKEGYCLSSRIEEESKANGKMVYRVTDPDKEQSFRICLGDKLTLAMVKKLNLSKDDLFVCRDVALDDELAANLALQCRLKTI